MAVAEVKPGERVKEKSSLENAAMLLGIGAQLGQLAFSAKEAFAKQPAGQVPAQPVQAPVMSGPINYDTNPFYTSRG